MDLSFVLPAPTGAVSTKNNLTVGPNIGDHLENNTHTHTFTNTTRTHNTQIGRLEGIPPLLDRTSITICEFFLGEDQDIFSFFQNSWGPGSLLFPYSAIFSPALGLPGWPWCCGAPARCKLRRPGVLFVRSAMETMAAAASSFCLVGVLLAYRVSLCWVSFQATPSGTTTIFFIFWNFDPHRRYHASARCLRRSPHGPRGMNSPPRPEAAFSHAVKPDVVFCPQEAQALSKSSAPQGSNGRHEAPFCPSRSAPTAEKKDCPRIRLGIFRPQLRFL